MNRFIKLVNFELSRFMKIYIALIVLTGLIQLTGVFVTANSFMAEADRMIYEQGMSQAQFIEQYGAMTFLNFAKSLWFVGPIAICAAALLFYVFMIWYRDWFGKNTFIYRLLMLPTARLNVFLAKAASIMLMVLGLVSIQLILLTLENAVFKWIVPVDLRVDMTLGQIVKWDYLSIIIPQTFTEFILYYGAGFMFVSVMFTALLIERSFGWKGLLLGAGYTAIAALVMLSPLLMIAFTGQYDLYPLETLGLEIGLGIVITAVSVWMGHYLLTKKITV
ncbi:hypothetical protein SAMN05216238_10978 [Lentibacillus persicus]|uniref:ABC-2 family transporter protein n=1 Tax=Lentibacillus persicus TaxID=640948 RepID=A0A1I1YC82_9BACI|nr:hypothetical protein [Lentibacillus persicus]SFE16608.1 hypothetical protein SAMN05216238_10978 [Lentibacillus persicus]